MAQMQAQFGLMVLSWMRYQDALLEAKERLIWHDFPPTPPAPEAAAPPKAKPTLRLIQGGLAAGLLFILVVPAIASTDVATWNAGKVVGVCVIQHMEQFPYANYQQVISDKDSLYRMSHECIPQVESFMNICRAQSSDQDCLATWGASLLLGAASYFCAEKHEAFACERLAAIMQESK
jgi:hypothetical protein